MTAEDVQAIVGALVPELRAEVERLLAHERALRDLALKGAQDAFNARLGAMEGRPLPPGPPGEPGPPGAPGKPGADGKPGLTYCGVFVEGKTYDHGDCVTYAGSLWHCDLDATTTKPGDGAKGWTLTVKRGRDGKDGRP